MAAVPNSVEAAVHEDGVRDFDSNGCVAAAEAAAAVVAQISGASTGESQPHAFSWLFLVDFTFVKAGNITEVVEIAWIAYDIEARQMAEETSILVRPEQLLAPAETLAKLDVTHEKLSAASTLADAVQRFDLAFFQKCPASGKPAILCTFGPDKLVKDFRGCAASRQVTLFNYFSHFVDLKQLLPRFMQRKCSR